MAPQSSTLAWKIPWTEEPGGLQSMGWLGVVHDWATSLSLFTFMLGEGNSNPLQCSCLENLRDGGACWAAMGSHRVGHDWSDLAAAAAGRWWTTTNVKPWKVTLSLVRFLLKFWNYCTNRSTFSTFLLNWPCSGSSYTLHNIFPKDSIFWVGSMVPVLLS